MSIIISKANHLCIHAFSSITSFCVVTTLSHVDKLNAKILTLRTTRKRFKPLQGKHKINEGGSFLVSRINTGILLHCRILFAIVNLYKCVINACLNLLQ